MAKLNEEIKEFVKKQPFTVIITISVFRPIRPI